MNAELYKSHHQERKLKRKTIKLSIKLKDSVGYTSFDKTILQKS